MPLFFSPAAEDLGVVRCHECDKLIEPVDDCYYDDYDLYVCMECYPKMKEIADCE